MQKKKKQDDEYYDEEEDEEEEEEEDSKPKKGGNTAKQATTAPQKGKNLAKKKEESEEEEEDEEEDEEPQRKPPAIVSKGNKKREEASEDDQANGKRQKKQRMKKKVNHYFDFNDESDVDIGSSPQYLEEGHPMEEVEGLNDYFSQRNKNSSKPRRKMAKQIRYKNLFFTSRCFMLYHFVQNFIFYLLLIIFPVISVTGCVTGFAWMSHVAMGLFCGLSFVFDCVFAG